MDNQRRRARRPTTHGNPAQWISEPIHPINPTRRPTYHQRIVPKCPFCQPCYSAEHPRYLPNQGRINFNPNTHSYTLRSNFPFTKYETQDGKAIFRQNLIFDCIRCGRTHLNGYCPAIGKKCYNCKSYNHFSRCCIKRTINNNVE